MDSSSQTRAKQSKLVIGVTTNSANSILPDSSKRGLKRDARNYEDGGDHDNLSVKKSRTMVNSDDGNKFAEPKSRKLSRQFWKAGDDKEDERSPRDFSHDAAVRVHPQFLHANATSHKWALGALAELLDNSFDEVCNGATYVHIDSATNEKDGKSSILIIQDNGGGMNPSRFRECLSLGYSRKRNMANTVGQYGNGFKTSTMRLGADAIVFSRSRGTNGSNTTESVGMLSYTYLYETRKSEAVVPTVDFELVDNNWKEIAHGSTDEWHDKLETIVKWSPYLSQQALFDQFDSLGEQGTRIVVYNLWEDDEGKLELDFDTDPHDIQLRGVNRDEKKIEMAKAHPNSRHFLTYRHSLRSYASILYLRLPPNFKIILRGKDVKHHSLLEDMMMTEDITYRPVASLECSTDKDMVAALKIGFVKDAHHHIDIQGFNVYHKNRLIKPFWRVWNAAGSDGRGVIGVLEADFIQPAHNKQGFERTALLARVENRLNTYQKTYWSKRCHEIGYAPRRKQTNHESYVTETSRQPGQKFQVSDFNRNKGSARCRENVEAFGKNGNSQDTTQSSVVGKHGLGISTNETRSINQASKLQKQQAQLDSQLKQSKAKIHDSEKTHKLNDATEKSVVEQQKQKAQLEERTQNVKDGSTKQVAELQRQKAQLELQLKQSTTARIQDLEKAQNVKDGSTKQVAELQRKQSTTARIQDLEKAQNVKDGSTKQVAELQRQKAQLELQLKQSTARIQDLEKTQNEKDGSTKEVVMLQRQKAVLELQLKQSTARIQDLEKTQNEKDGSTKEVVMLQRQKAVLELQLKRSKSMVQVLEKSQKELDESAKLVVELQRQKKLLESQLNVSQAKNRGLEKSVIDTFQEERARRDLTEDALRKKLRGANDVIDNLTMKVNSLEAEQAFCKKVHMHMH